MFTTVQTVPDEPQVPLDPQEIEGVDYLDAPADGCKAILDKRGAYNLSMVCGRPRGEYVNGSPSPYCPEHHRKFNTGTLRRS